MLIVRGQEAVELAHELARLSGESIETAVTNAIRQRLDLERGKIARFQNFLVLAAKRRPAPGGTGR